MSKYKIVSEFEIDFDKIFNEIPNGLFADGGGNDEYYEKQVIYDVIKEGYLQALMKNMEDLASDKENGLYKYLKHHNECTIPASKAIVENLKIVKL